MLTDACPSALLAHTAVLTMLIDATPCTLAGSVGIRLETGCSQVAILAGGSILMLAYMAHVAERDWQVRD